MANIAISQLGALSGSLASGDLLPIVDVSDTTQSVNGSTKKVTASAVQSYVLNGLTSSNVAEGSNLYFTDARVRAAALTGLSVADGTVSTSDTVISALGKLAYKASNPPVTSVNSLTGAVTLSTTNIGEGSNLYFTNARAIGSALTGFVAGDGTVTSSDTILSALQKTYYKASNATVNWAAPGAIGSTTPNTGAFTTVTATSFSGSGASLTGLTKTQVGLGNVDNTSDANKPVSTATQTALNAKAATGAIGSSGLTMSTAKLLGRTTASTGAVEEIGIGAGLALTGGTLSATGGGGGSFDAASPGPIGSTTPSSGAFTTLNASTSVSSDLIQSQNGTAFSIGPEGIFYLYEGAESNALTFIASSGSLSVRGTFGASGMSQLVGGFRAFDHSAIGSSAIPDQQQTYPSWPVEAEVAVAASVSSATPTVRKRAIIADLVANLNGDPADDMLALDARTLINGSTTASTITQNILGAYSEVAHESGAAVTYSAAHNMKFFHDGAGTITTGEGNYASLENLNNGTVTFARALSAFIGNSGTGTLTNAASLYLNTPENSGGGTITNLIGIVLNDHSGIGTTKSLNIESRGANSKNVFEGSLRVGAGNYVNFGTTDGTSGYGLRDSSGTIQFKNSGGSWANIPSAVTPAGSGTELQFRNGSSFGAVTGSSWNGATLTLANTGVAAGTATLSASVNGSFAFAISQRSDNGGPQVAVMDFTFVGTSLRYNGNNNTYDIGTHTFSDTNGGLLSISGDVSSSQLSARNNILSLRNSTNAQNLHVYNTYTSGTNYERAGLYWAGNNFYVATENAGTGSARHIVFRTGGLDKWILNASGGFYPATDNVYDIGNGGSNRPANIFVGNRVTTPILTLGTNVTVSTNASGVLTITNTAEDNFNRIQLGGTSASFPAIKRSGAGVEIRKADDSGLADLTAGTVTATAFVGDGSGLTNLPSGGGGSTTSRTITGTTGTVVSGDNGNVIICTSSSAVTITVPAGLGANFTTTVIQKGSGQVTFVASSTTINSYGSLVSTAGQHAAATLFATAADEFNLSGILA